MGLRAALACLQAIVVSANPARIRL